MSVKTRLVMNHGGVAQLLNQVNGEPDIRGLGIDHKILGSQPQAHWPGCGNPVAGRHRYLQLGTVGERQQQTAILTAANANRQEAGRGLAEKARDESISRTIVEIERRPHLLDPSVAHHRDSARQRHGFDLVVRDVDDGIADALMEARQFNAHFGTQRHRGWSGSSNR